MTTTHYEQIGVAMTCRGFNEYVRMFDLNETLLSRGSVLDVAGGASSFTAELCGRGADAYAVDPRYSKNANEWIREATEEITVSTAKIDKLKGTFDWSYYGNVKLHRAGREESLRRFVSHLSEEEGKQRYIAGGLPQLPFADGTFSLALCSHFLFLYAEQFGFEFHKQSVLELMRVCKPGGEVRIYPLLSLNWERYERLDELLIAIREAGGEPEICQSNLPFIPGSDHYLKIVLR
ncbi:class I SAM-dependent methyltransferase [Paenibacillus sp. NPDC058071]|uniref:class I SAM-dependent methyltransferase n=1 Tax=Paenibacillus sp. NPDC058071 TaxID=3346326 RepID=UPI0036DBB53E